MDVTLEVLNVMTATQAYTQVYRVMPRRGTQLSIIGNPIMRVSYHVCPTQLRTGQLCHARVIYDVNSNYLIATSLIPCGD